MTTDDVIAAIQEFVPVDSDTDNVVRLYDIFEDFRVQPDRAKVIPVLFRFLEKYPEADLGSPGPIVHEIEAIGGYEEELWKSVLAQPGYLNIWMVNRILNITTNPEQREQWLSSLRAAATYPSAAQWIKDDALSFIELQLGRAK